MPKTQIKLGGLTPYSLTLTWLWFMSMWINYSIGISYNFWFVSFKSDEANSMNLQFTRLLVWEKCWIIGDDLYSGFVIVLSFVSELHEIWRKLNNKRMWKNGKSVKWFITFRVLTNRIESNRNLSTSANIYQFSFLNISCIYAKQMKGWNFPPLWTVAHKIFKISRHHCWKLYLASLI